jgi:hypothetical protein
LVAVILQGSKDVGCTNGLLTALSLRIMLIIIMAVATIIVAVQQ